MTIRPTAALLAGTVGAVTVLLAGCSGSTSAEPAPTVTVTVTVTAEPSPAGQEPTPEASPTVTEASPTPMGDPVSADVKFVGKRTAVGAARSQDFFEMRLDYTNDSDKKITAIKGRIILADPFGEEVFNGGWQATGLRLDPGDTFVQKERGFIVEGSTGAAGCRGGVAEAYGYDGLCRAASDKFKDYTWTFEPESVKFGDKSLWP